jgi:glycosyltransferase involved in cell wall biosynthesis
MLKKKNKSIKILVLVTAYNVENFLESVLNRIPKSIKKYNTQILIYDDASDDKTYKKALKLKKKKNTILILFEIKKTLVMGAAKKQVILMR